MAYCGPLGLELDTFLRWSARSQAAALAWSAQEARRCRSCGSHPDDWSEDPHAHHAHLTQCKGCQATQRLRESEDARQGGRGLSVALAPGSGADCPRCQPLDD